MLNEAREKQKKLRTRRNDNFDGIVLVGQPLLVLGLDRVHKHLRHVLSHERVRDGSVSPHLVLAQALVALARAASVHAAVHG